MSDTDLERLRARLDAAPGNALLRLTLIRRLIAADAPSEALALALDLAPEAVSRAGDRAVLADLFEAAGLEEDVALWRAGAAPAPAPAPPGERALRVVGGREAETEAEEAPVRALPESVTFADIGGLEAVKRDIHRRIVLPFAKPSLVGRFRKKAGGGVLLYGPPGCGKTLLARATAGECGAKFVAGHLSEVLDPYLGVSEKRLSGLFASARETPPAVLFFDEIDALAARRAAVTSSHIAQLSSHFLAELDGIGARNDGMMILAATNAPWALDPAFLRPGRFDRLFFVPPPDRAARAHIFARELSGRLLAEEVDPEALAAATSGRSGADIAGIVERASDTAIDATLAAGREVPISQAMLTAAVAETRSSVGDWLATARNHATYANEGGRYDDILAFLERHGRGRR